MNSNGWVIHSGSVTVQATAGPESIRSIMIPAETETGSCLLSLCEGIKRNGGKANSCGFLMEITAVGASGGGGHVRKQLSSRSRGC